MVRRMTVVPWVLPFPPRRHQHSQRIQRNQLIRLTPAPIDRVHIRGKLAHWHPVVSFGFPTPIGLALRGHRQSREKIGVLARTSQTAAQQATPKKAAETRAAKKG